MIKIKKDVFVHSSEFWYDIKEGYLIPEEICENKEDAKKVNEAIAILYEFEDSCYDQIEGFLQ